MTKKRSIEETINLLDQLTKGFDQLHVIIDRIEDSKPFRLPYSRKQTTEDILMFNFNSKYKDILNLPQFDAHFLIGTIVPEESKYVDKKKTSIQPRV